MFANLVIDNRAVKALQGLEEMNHLAGWSYLHWHKEQEICDPLVKVTYSY